eukprot:SRR837773.13315.p1 GENE.SRR837773.13315~~SRR837773.13315.p1  ORF type:complete len:336 (-),score=125.86 SRR837773.13315:35-973(-)
MGAQHVLAVGGGSPMDVAKLASCLAAKGNSQRLHDMYGVNMVRGGRLPLTLVPTTAGSGSVTTAAAVVTEHLAGQQPTKKGTVSPVLLPDQAVLDAELTLSLPRHVTADTGVDAMVHCIEAYTSRLKKNPLSDTLAKGALEMLARNVRTVAGTRPDDVEARSAMLLASYMAGMAFNSAPVGAVHALAYPIGTCLNLSHGAANALILPYVLDFNRRCPRAAALYADLAPHLSPEDEPSSGVFGRGDASEAFVLRLRQLTKDLGMKATLAEAGATAEDIPMLLREALKQTRLLPNNVREVSEKDIEQIYREALG